MGGISRAVNRLLGLWVVLVSAQGPGFGVFLRETWRLANI